MIIEIGPDLKEILLVFGGILFIALFVWAIFKD